MLSNKLRREKLLHVAAFVAAMLFCFGAMALIAYGRGIFDG